MAWNQASGGVAAGGGGGGSGDVTGVTVSSPLAVSSSGGPVPNISIPAASGATAGSMSIANFNKLAGIASDINTQAADAQTDATQALADAATANTAVAVLDARLTDAINGTLG